MKTKFMHDWRNILYITNILRLSSAWNLYCEMNMCSSCNRGSSEYKTNRLQGSFLFAAADGCHPAVHSNAQRNSSLSRRIVHLVKWTLFHRSLYLNNFFKAFKMLQKFVTRSWPSGVCFPSPIQFHSPIAIFVPVHVDVQAFDYFRKKVRAMCYGYVNAHCTWH